MTDTPNTDVLAARAREVLAAEMNDNHAASTFLAGADRLISTRASIRAMLRFAKEATPQSDGTAMAVGEVERLRDALKWALPLAERAMDDHRLERIRCGHTDISGTYTNGVTWSGIWQAEVDQIEAARAALATAPKVASDTMREAGLLRTLSRAIHEHLCRRDIMQYLDNEEDCEGLARAVMAALSTATALSVQSPANAGRDGEGVKP